MEDRWGVPPEGQDDLELLVHLSRLVGQEQSLVQPGGGNSSIKLSDGNDGEPTLAVKGSGIDLCTVTRTDFTRLSLKRLAGLRQRREMSDEEMMDLMGGCMVHPHRDPFPSVETPLHAVLPGRVIIHTHDLATMSLTNVEERTARDLLVDLYGKRIVYVPYVRPGFPLARALMDLADGIGDAEGLALAHHGLVTWGDDPRSCYAQLVELVSQAEQFLDCRKKNAGLRFSARSAKELSGRRRQAAAGVLLPVIRGALGDKQRPILSWNDGERILEALADERFAELSQRGVATPEHILRAGRLPLWLDLDLGQPAAVLAEQARARIAEQQQGYLEYHRRHAAAGLEPLDDWAKVVLIPGLGMVTAFRDTRSAQVAGGCYRAVIDTMENAEALGGFRFIPEADVHAFEHWSLERRKVERTHARENERLLLPRRIALIIGGGSGIGEATAWRFAEEGAHVMVADLDGDRAAAVAAKVAGACHGRAAATAVDVADEESIQAAVQQTVLAFGGLDCLFYTAGRAPDFAPIAEVQRDNLAAQMEIHYLGAILAIREAAAVLIRQGLGGTILCSVSKAALAAGRGAVAYGGSKAALQHALRVAAVELGEAGIRVNAINADQVDTPLFRRFVEARAASAGRTVEEQLAVYRSRNALGVSLIPARAVADLAAFAASPRLRYTTGDILTVDGGLADAFPR